MISKINFINEWFHVKRFHVETLGVHAVSMMSVMFLSLHTTFAMAKATLKCRNICELYLKVIWRNDWRTENDWNGSATVCSWFQKTSHNYIKFSRNSDLILINLKFQSKQEKITNMIFLCIELPWATLTSFLSEGLASLSSHRRLGDVLSMA